MTTSAPQTVWEKSDRLLSGGMIAVRAVTVPHDGESKAAVAVTVHISADQASTVDTDGSMTATILVGPGEALGISAWLRQAALAADSVAAPLYDWPGER